MAIKCAKSYDPEAYYGLVPILPTISTLDDTTTITFDLNKQQTAFFYHGDQQATDCFLLSW